MTKPGTASHTAPSVGGLHPTPTEVVAVRVAEYRWRWPVVLALLLTIPAFYLELEAAAPRGWAITSYLLAALVVALALAHAARASGRPGAHARAHAFDLTLVAGLLVAAVLPTSVASGFALGVRSAVALLILARLVRGLQHIVTRGSLSTMLMSAFAVLLLCGAGYRWLEPTTPTLAEGLWLAFVTAATVGYGDVVPTTPASKIFSFFVVLLGFGVLTLVTAAIATKWVETEERLIEREILRDMHRQMNALRAEIAALRDDLAHGPRHDGQHDARHDDPPRRP